MQVSDMSLASFISKEDFTPPAQTDVTYQPLDLASDVNVTHEPEVSDAEVSQQAILGQIAEHEEAVVAIEGYLELLRQNPNGIAAQTAAAIAIGLEQYQPLLGDEFKLMPGLEAFGGTMSRGEATAVSVEALVETLNNAAGKIRELLKKLYEWAVKAYDMFFDQVTQQQDLVKRLTDEVGKLPNAPATMMVEINSPGALMVGNKFVGQDPTPLAGVAVWAGTVYPRQMTSLLNDLARAVQAGGEVESVIAKHAPSLNFKGADSVLPGNVTIGFASGHSQKVVVTQKGQASQGISAQVAKPQDLRKRLGQLTNVLTEMSKVKSYPGDINRQLASLGKAYEMGKIKATEAVVSKYATDVVTGLDDLLKYLLRTTHAYLAVIQHEIKAYGQGRAE